MIVLVDKETCIGCGLCVGLAEKVFEMNKDKAQPIKYADLTDPKNQKTAKEAVENCPVIAISIKI